MSGLFSHLSTRRNFLKSFGASIFTVAFSACKRSPIFNAPPEGSVSTPEAPAPLHPEVEFSLAFGSCNFQWKDQKHWDVIAEKKPDQWIWLGDCIYSDYLPPSMRRMSYNLLKKNSYYKRFTQTIPVTGTWDDHDYGLNNSGKDFIYKESSQKLFCDFLDLPADAPRRKQDGIYCSKVLSKLNQSIKLVLLDLRFHREQEGPMAQLLGEDQWRWLEEEILFPEEAKVIVLGSSIQVIASIKDGDGWDGFPAERERLIRLIEKSPVPVVILSGDVHWSEISQLSIAPAESGQKVLIDFTSSGLTHSDQNPYENPARVGPKLAEPGFGLLRLKLGGSRITPEFDFEIFRSSGELFYKTSASALNVLP